MMLIAIVDKDGRIFLFNIAAFVAVLDGLATDEDYRYVANFPDQNGPWCRMRLAGCDHNIIVRMSAQEFQTQLNDKIGQMGRQSALMNAPLVARAQ